MALLISESLAETSPTVSPSVDSGTFSSIAPAAPTQNVDINTPSLSASTADDPSTGSVKDSRGPPKPEPVKPKRGRGRPRKTIAHSSASSIAPTASGAPPLAPASTVAPNGSVKNSGPPIPTVVEPDKPKRGRGRPRKNPQKPAIASMKRGRGRPRKNPDPVKEPAGREAQVVKIPSLKPAVVEEGEEEEAIAMSAAAKRKRGRPKKVRPLPGATATNMNTTDDQSEPPPPPPKKRGRPKKVVDTIDDQNKPKKKRGRPSKKTTVSNQDNHSEPTPAKQTKLDTKLVQTEPTKRPRGRPRKIESPIPDPEPVLIISTNPEPEFLRLEDSSSDGEVAENIASLISRNGVLQDRDEVQEQQDTMEQQDRGGESSDSSYITPEP